MERAPIRIRRQPAPEIEPFAAAIADTADESVVIYDAEGRVLHWNHTSQLFYGWGKTDVLGHYLHDLMGPLADEGHWRDLLANDSWRGPVQRRTPAGELVLVNIRASVIRDASRHVTRVVEFGARADVRVETDLAHAARISVLGELTTSIAHEVRQPLSVIVTDADTALRWLDREDPNLAKVKALITRIMGNAHRANDVIRRIKDMAIKSDPVRQPVNLNAVVNEAAIFVRTESQSHSIAVRTRLTNRLPSISGDRVQLQQVVVNLLINSIQAIASNGKTLRDIIIETGFDGNGIVRLSVCDSGGGIPPDDLDRIFDGFFSTKSDGIGMGLAICRSIIADHGGTIKAGNLADIGAEFQITLPVLEPMIVPNGAKL